jgi:two-component system, OmpR family, sensor histidine kinase KdpD
VTKPSAAAASNLAVVNLHGRRLGVGVTSSSELVVGVLTGAGAVALVTAAIAVLESWAPILSLGALYVFAVLPVAVLWGLVLAIPAAVGSVLAFNWFFLPPTHTFRLSQSENWLALAVYVVVAVVTSELAARARRRATLAEQREREAALLASVATSLLRGEPLAVELGRISEGMAEVLGVPHARIALADEPSDEPLVTRELVIGGRSVGTLGTTAEQHVDESVAARFLPALASLLAVAVDQDELQQEALEAEALRRSDTVKTALLRAVSHDLRSPLTAIRAAAGSLANPALTLTPGDRHALVETVGVESARLERLVDDLLDLSRLQAGAVTARRELWSLEDLVGLARNDADPDGRVSADIPDGLPPLEVDAAHIRRVLANVLDNALRVSSPGAPVRVTAAANGREVVLRVADSGPGIDPAELERIFEPFRRGRAAESYPGSGLGLAIARGFAEANGGRLWAEHAAHGTVVVLALPSAKPDPPA